MKRGTVWKRHCGVVVCLVTASCTSVLHQVPSFREETRLTTSENRRIAVILEEMSAGWQGMQRGTISARRKAQDKYDKALGRFLLEWDGAQSPRYWQTGTVFSSGKRSFRVEFDPHSDQRREVPPTRLDEIILPYKVKPREQYTLAQRPGIGVPLVGHIRGTRQVRQEQPFLPPNGGNLTLTATMEMGTQQADPSVPQSCKLHLHNALNVETVKVAGDERLLSAHFTASKQRALSKRSLNPFAWLGIIYPESTLKDCQLYQMDVYDPNRIPVVFVHGLVSDPHIWLNVVSAICEDPKLRAAYQPWYFLYPTAIGIPQSSERLRESLQAALNHFDPDRNDPGPSKMVIVGHSMGGLLARMQAIDPEDKLWNALFRVAPDDLRVSDTARERLKSTLQFDPRPEVKRLVFIATPHRGSNLASMNFVRRLASLIRLPVDTLRMSQELLLGNTDALSPQLRDWGSFGFLSLGMLSDKHPYYKGLNNVKIPVEHHSIIAQIGKNGRISKSDGVVPYRSSHLDSAKSETVVQWWHGCVERPEVVQEVVRILHEHLKKVGR